MHTINGEKSSDTSETKETSPEEGSKHFWSFQHQNIVHNSYFVNYILITPNFVFKTKQKTTPQQQQQTE